jgi:HSP20 family protein
MFSLSNALDRWFEDAFMGNQFNFPEGFNYGFPVDVVEKENEFVVKASLPGINPDDLDITFTNGVLSIRGEFKEEQGNEDEQYHMRERRYGTFTRSISLPTSINADQIDASYQDGVLSLTLPKAEEAKPKRIPIHAGQSGKMIEGRSKS